MDSPVDLVDQGLQLDIRLGQVREGNVIRERDQDFGRWELDGPKGRVAIRVSGPLSANNGEIVRQWAIDGHGIILRSTWDIAREITAGVLLPVLPAYSQPADV